MQKEKKVEIKRNRKRNDQTAKERDLDSQKGITHTWETEKERKEQNKTLRFFVFFLGHLIIISISSSISSRSSSSSNRSSSIKEAVKDDVSESKVVRDWLRAVSMSFFFFLIFLIEVKEALNRSQRNFYIADKTKKVHAYIHSQLRKNRRWSCCWFSCVVVFFFCLLSVCSLSSWFCCLSFFLYVNCFLPVVLVGFLPSSFLFIIFFSCPLFSVRVYRNCC